MTGVYIHVPFCVKKCAYCSFYSESGAEKFEGAYVKKVVREAEKYNGETADTLYFGGGTPSALSADALIFMLRGIKRFIKFSDDSEITIEANPKTVTEEKLKKLFDAGFNRISFGFQSFSDDELKFLGRIHSADDNKKALAAAHAAGFKNISGDIMTAIPLQTMNSLKKTINTMCALELSHISAYSLSVEKGTPFYEAELSLPDEDTEREMYYTLCDMLENAGYEHYEISNFAKDGAVSRHNTKYWTGEPYIGLGAAAHSYYKNERYCNISSIKGYTEKEETEEFREYIDENEKKKERVMLGLRLKSGIPYEKNPKTDKFIEQGFMQRCGENVRLTRRGIDISNYIFSELI